MKPFYIKTDLLTTDQLIDLCDAVIVYGAHQFDAITGSRFGGIFPLTGSRRYIGVSSCNNFITYSSPSSFGLSATRLHSYEEATEWVAKHGKINVNKLACFREVAKVIGTNNAAVELFKALNHYESTAKPIIKVNRPLVSAFHWVDTPQGHEFWSSIHKGAIPHDN